MAEQVRLHDQMLRERLSQHRTAFVSGPRQVGKTTACRGLSPYYIDWNDVADRVLILKGPEAVGRHLGLERSREREATVVIDNLHGHRNWRSFLRKFSARYGTRVRLVITMLCDKNSVPANSALVRINPWTVGECARAVVPTDSPVKTPANISDADWAALLEHGGFPEPFRKRDPKFTQRWRAWRESELIGHELPRLAAVRDPALVQVLTVLLSEASATPLVYSDLSRELGVTVDTVRRWLELLVGLHYGFCIRPWFAGVPRALRKEPKWFLRDWSGVTDPRARGRTFVACHLLKAAEGWADLGLGQFELRYVRDKSQREVDFLVLRDRRPWFLLSVPGEASMDDPVTPALEYFQRRTRARHAFQVVLDGPFSGADCFQQSEPAVVSARTLLSQLL
jgi:uncharacterized protein